MVMFKARFDDVQDKPGARSTRTEAPRAAGDARPSPRPQRAEGWRESPGWQASTPAPTAPPVEKERGPQAPIQEPPGSADPPQRA